MDSRQGVTRRTIVLGILGLCILFALEFNPVFDTDVFWQIRLGQRMLAERSLILRDNFTYTYPGMPTPPVGWLGQVLFSLLFDAGGWRLLRLVHHGVIVLSLLSVAVITSPRRAGPLASALAILAGFIVLAHNVALRPQGIAALGFGLVLGIARSEWKPLHKFALVIPIALVWQNVHPSVLTGALAVAAIAVADTWTTWRAGALRWPWAIAGLALLLGLVQLATPLGWAIFPIAKANLHVARDLIRTGEWLPPWDPSVLRALAPFWVAFSITVLVLPRLWRIADARDLSLLLLISVLSMSATRFVMLWALSLVPLWATWFEHAWPRGLFASWRENGRTGFSPWRCAGVGVLTVLAILLGHPARYLPIVRSEIPLAGVATLRSWLPDEARIYNDYVWAGPLLLEGKSGWRVAVDGRLYCYPDDEFWHRREAEAAGQFRLAVLEATHRMDAFVLNRAFDRVLIEEIERSRSWRLVHLGRECVMFVRADLSPHDRNRPASSGWTVLGVSPRAPRAPVPDRDRTVVSRAAWSSL